MGCCAYSSVAEGGGRGVASGLRLEGRLCGTLMGGGGMGYVEGLRLEGRRWDRTGAGGAGKGRKRGHTVCETAARRTPGVPGPGLTLLRLQAQLFGTLFGGISQSRLVVMSQKIKNLKRSGKN